jgi:CYTH domain-containing protein
MGAQPKYSLAEIERRWLVSPGSLFMLEGQPYCEIEDLYVGETQLRLRKVSSASGEVVYKFCKKYSKYSSLSQPITNLYLSETEYRALAALKGNVVRKRRYFVAGGSVDVYHGSPVVAVFEVEFDSEREAERYVPPGFAGEEVTNNASYSGAALASRVV